MDVKAKPRTGSFRRGRFHRIIVTLESDTLVKLERLAHEEHEDVVARAARALIKEGLRDGA